MQSRISGNRRPTVKLQAGACSSGGDMAYPMSVVTVCLVGRSGAGMQRELIPAAAINQM